MMLVLRAHPAEGRYPLETGAPVRLRNLGQVLAAHHLLSLLENAQLAGDRLRGELLVAGDHHGADAGLVEIPDGVFHPLGRGIDDPRQPDEGEPGEGRFLG
jgi:hypothetical protein